MGYVCRLPKCLSDHLRSSLVLSDLPQAVDELICNSLDAGAKNILVSVDVGAFYLKVEDDGSGITRDDLMLVGERHATSKLHDLLDLENGVATLGFRGEALSSISEVAVLEVITRVRGSPNTYKKVLKGSLKLSMGISSEQRSPGTTVVVHELFHNLPVRRKNIQSSSRKVLQGVKDHVIRLALVHPDVTFTVIDLERKNYLVQTKPCLSSLDVFCQFFGEQYHSQLLKMHYRTEDLKLDGFISTMETSRSSIKGLQFLYINGRYVHKTPIHKLINSTLNDHMGLGNSVDAWVIPSRHRFPEFVLNLICPLSCYDITFEAAKTYVEFKDWSRILFSVKNALKTVWSTALNRLDAVKEETDASEKLVDRKRKPWECIDPRYIPKFSVDTADYQVDNSYDRGGEFIVGMPKRQKCPREGNQCEYSLCKIGRCGDSFTSTWSLQQCKDGKSGKSCEQFEMTDFESLNVRSNRHSLNCDILENISESKKLHKELDSQRIWGVDYIDKNIDIDLTENIFNSAKVNGYINDLYRVSPLKCESDEYDPHCRVEELASNSDPEILLYTREWNGDNIRLHRDGHASDILESPLKIRERFSPYQMGVRRCLYDVALKDCYSDDHSERQKVNNFFVKSAIDREWIINSDNASLYDSMHNDLDEVLCNQGDGKNSFNRFNIDIDSDNNIEQLISLTSCSHVGHTNVSLEKICFGSKDEQTQGRNLNGESSMKSLRRTRSAPPFYRVPGNHSGIFRPQLSTNPIKLQSIETLKVCQSSGCKNAAFDDGRQSEIAIRHLSAEKDANATQSKDLNGNLPVDADYGFSSCSKWRNVEENDHNKCNLIDVDMSATQMYKEWKNPCMKSNDLRILDLSSVNLGHSRNNLLPQSISKEKLQTARVLQQIEKKFIAAVADKTLLIIDQHAADERVRLEQLREEVLDEKKHQSFLLNCPQEIGISMVEHQLLQVYQSHLEYWGWHFRLPSETSMSRQVHNGDTAVLLTAVPTIFGEKLTNRNSLSEYLHQLAATDGISVPPPAVLRLIASKACRGAIMFGDFLLSSECQQLVDGLKRTSLAFQCAHGRPTLVPLLNLEALHLLLRSENRMGENQCDSSVEKLGRIYPHSRSSWHGLQWHPPTLQRAMDRLRKCR